MFCIHCKKTLTSGKNSTHCINIPWQFGGYQISFYSQSQWIQFWIDSFDLNPQRINQVDLNQKELNHFDLNQQRINPVDLNQRRIKIVDLNQKNTTKITLYFNITSDICGSTQYWANISIISTVTLNKMNVDILHNYLIC